MAEPAGGTPSGGGFGGFWARRSRKGKLWLVLGSIIGLIVLISALASPSEDKSKQAAIPTEQQEAATTEVATETTTTEDVEPPPPPVERAPRPITLRGQGARVETIQLAKDSPVIVQATHRGSANFVIELVGAGTELLVNEIGNYSGRVAYADAAAGRYRVKITADGPWTIKFTQPVPTPTAKLVPGTFSGRGPDVLKVRTEEDLQPIVDVRHRGQANFVVELIGYGDSSGSELLVNEIGNYSGQTLVDDMPQGSYLLAVQADGPWTVKFTR